MYKVIILSPAKNDINEAARWYNEREKGLGNHFIKELKLKINLIKINPIGYSIRYYNIRTTTVNRFPFMIHFKIEETKKAILITAVIHTKKNPRIWNKRLE